MTSWKKQLFLATAIVVVTVLAALIFITPRTTPEEPLPNPNGYEDFAKAGALVSAGTSDWNSLSVEQLHQLVATNQPALELIRSGLTKECRVVPYMITAATNNNDHMSELTNHKRAAHAFCAASRLALLEGRTNDAALLALDCIRYAHESTRGGVIIDGMFGLAVQAIGRPRLEEALAGTDAETSRKVVAALDQVGNRRESSGEIIKREAQWARRGRFGSGGILTQLILPFQMRKIRAGVEQKFIKGSTDLQRTKIHAAVRAYELDHGKPPATARELVPQYLKFIPIDPATGNELPLN